jgi:hypothetical protein
MNRHLNNAGQVEKQVTLRERHSWEEKGERRK